MTIPARKVPEIRSQLEEIRRASKTLDAWGYEATARSLKIIARSIEREVQAVTIEIDEAARVTKVAEVAAPNTAKRAGRN